MFSILTILCAIVTASPVKKGTALGTAALASSLCTGDAFIPITTLSKSSTKQPQPAFALKSSKDKSIDSLFDNTFFEDDENEFDIEKILNEDTIDEYLSNQDKRKGDEALLQFHEYEKHSVPDEEQFDLYLSNLDWKNSDDGSDKTFTKWEDYNWRDDDDGVNEFFE